MALDPRQHQGLFGESFVHVLASAAGLTVAKSDLDVTGEDFTLTHNGPLGGVRIPKIDVQVKSWSKPGAAKYRDGIWKYGLPAGQFNKLAGTGFDLRRYLFLVIVPADLSSYADGQQGQLVLRHSAYWVSLKDREPVDADPKSNIAVDVPAANLLTVDTLLGLMKSASAEELVSP